MGSGSEIRDQEKTYSGSRIQDPGVKKAPDPGSGSATLEIRHRYIFSEQIYNSTEQQ
jgi:hypothetical protein